ncbi:hypothetical protein Tco_1577663 [Tanacetum coccineum]
MESLISNFQEIELYETQLVVKQLHSVRMLWFEQLETHLSNLYHNKLSRAADAFKPAFLAFFGAEHQAFGLKMFHNLDQLKLQFKRENLHEVHAKTCLKVLRLQFKEYLPHQRRNLIEYLDMLVDVLHESVLQYGILRMKENEINPIQAVDDSLIVSKSSLIETENNNALSKSENETQLQQHECLVTESTTLEAKVSMDVKALDGGMVAIDSNGTYSDKHDTSSSSRNHTTQAVDADIGPVNDEEPFAEV